MKPEILLRFSQTIERPGQNAAGIFHQRRKTDETLGDCQSEEKSGQ
jgi:hypothetical protein